MSCSVAPGMAALFPRWANGLARGAIAVVAVAIVGVPAALMAWVRTPFHRGQFYPTPQPVAFAHTVHAGDDAIDCRYCHHTAERTAYAGIPSTQLCLGCHRQILSASPLLAPVRWSVESSEPIPWRRVHNLPDHVYFDHAIHVGRGVGCVTCHGRVDLMPVVVQVAPLSMGWCLECHRYPERYLRPREQVTNMTWTPDRPQLELGLALKREHGVRELVTCTTCHR